MKSKILLIICFAIMTKSFINAQEVKNKQTLFKKYGIVDVQVIYPLMSDSILNNNPYLSDIRKTHLEKRYSSVFLYPTIIVNNMIITDTVMIDCFRNNYHDLLHKGYIVKDKWISTEKAKKMGIKDISKDGAIIIKTKKNLFIDLNKCCYYIKK